MPALRFFNYCFTDSLPYITNKHDFCRKNICYSRYKALENTTYFFNANISILATVSYTTLLRDSVAIRLCFFFCRKTSEIYSPAIFFFTFLRYKARNCVIFFKLLHVNNLFCRCRDFCTANNVRPLPIAWCLGNVHNLLVKLFCSRW